MRSRPYARSLPLEVGDLIEERLRDWVPVSAARLREVDGRWELTLQDPTIRLLPTDALEAMEEAMRLGEAEHGDRWRARSVAHHLGKSMGHARRALGRTPIDADSGLPHVTLAATRCVLALAVAIERANASLEGRRPC